MFTDHGVTAVHAIPIVVTVPVDIRRDLHQRRTKRMVVDHVEKDCATTLMRRVHEIGQRGAASIVSVDREVEGGIVPPRQRGAEFLHGHQLDRRDRQRA